MKSVLITGANGGIGAACARVFLTDWPAARVYLGCRAAKDNALALTAEFAPRASLLDLDVTDAAAWQRAVAHVVEETGRIDVLVNNAGTHQDRLLATMSDEDWHRVLAVNLTGTFFGCRAVVKAMLAQHSGRIINLSSLSALAAPAGQANYAAAKAGVVALTQSLAKEVARAGITVNTICPGYVDTKALGTDTALLAEMARRVPARRLGAPEEVAAAVLFLAGDSAGYINGAVLKMDGAMW